MSQPNEKNHDDHKYTKIFVGGLAWKTTTEDLRNFFEQFGEILDANVVYETYPERSKGYGFVTFKNPESAPRALKNSTPIIDGRQTNINLAFIRAKNTKNQSNQNGSLDQARPSHQYQNGSLDQAGPSHQYQNGSSNQMIPPQQHQQYFYPRQQYPQYIYPPYLQYYRLPHYPYMYNQTYSNHYLNGQQHTIPYYNPNFKKSPSLDRVPVRISKPLVPHKETTEQMMSFDNEEARIEPESDIENQEEEFKCGQENGINKDV